MGKDKAIHKTFDNKSREASKKKGGAKFDAGDKMQEMIDEASKRGIEVWELEEALAKEKKDKVEDESEEEKEETQLSDVEEDKEEQSEEEQIDTSKTKKPKVESEDEEEDLLLLGGNVKGSKVKDKKDEKKKKLVSVFDRDEKAANFEKLEEIRLQRELDARMKAEDAEKLADAKAK